MRSLAVVIVLAALASPVALAQEEDVNSALASAQVEVDYALLWGQQAADHYADPSHVDEHLPPSQPEEEPPAEEDDGSHTHGSNDEHAHDGHEETAAPPAEEEPAPQDNTLLGRVSRFVPIPVTLPGPAPRIDLDAIDRLVSEIQPLAPAPTAPDAPASAPIAPASVGTVAGPEIADAGSDASLVALGVAAAATAGAPAAITLWDRVRRLGWLAILYTRIAKERLLDHGSRERLLDAIRTKPGAAVSDLSEASDIPRNTVTYHLRVLEREGLVSSTRNGRNRLFFAPGSLPQRANADALATLRHETTLAVAKAVGANPGVDQKALCSALNLSPSLAHWHADRLVATGLVDKRRDGRNVRYYPGASFEIVAARSA